MIFADDHPTFLYRLWLLKQNFPFVPFYNPLWNGGIDARDFFATGTLNVFFLMAPLIYLFDLPGIYNLIITLIPFTLVPVLVFVAARIRGLTHPAPLIAGILSLSTGLLWYRWAFKYGTMGFITTSAFVPLNLVLVSRLLDSEGGLSRIQAILMVASFSLMLAWSPSGIVFAPAFLLCIIYLRTVLAKRYVIKIAAALIAINLPWMILFWSVSGVSRFLKYDTLQRTQHTQPAAAVDREAVSLSEEPIAEQPSARPKPAVSMARAIKIARENAVSLNPLILFLALPGILLLEKRFRLLVFVTFVWLLGMGLFAAQLKPQMELERMLLILALVAVLPVSVALADLFERATSSEWWPVGLCASLAGGFLLCGPFCTGSILLNRTIEQYHFASPQVQELADALRSRPDDGRIAFSGFVLHEFANGHLAPLVFMSGKSLMASSPFHDKWKYEGLIPGSFLENEEAGALEYLNLFNISTLAAHEPYWQKFFGDRPDQFEKLGQVGKFQLFAFKASQHSFFLEGSGKILAQTSNSVRLVTESDHAVIKFNYLPFLRASACKIAPREIRENIRFIELSECPVGAEIVLDSRGPLWRVRHAGE
jgi:hypothetical protein